MLTLHPLNSHSPIRFIKICINPLDPGNIQPDHPQETITKVSTKERKRIHNLSIVIKNTITGRNITGHNITDPITYTNTYGTTSPSVPIISPDDDDLPPTRVLTWYQMVQIQPVQVTRYHNNRNQILYLINTMSHFQFVHPYL